MFKAFYYRFHRAFEATLSAKYSFWNHKTPYAQHLLSVIFF